MSFDIGSVIQSVTEEWKEKHMPKQSVGNLADGSNEVKPSETPLRKPQTLGDLVLIRRLECDRGRLIELLKAV